jgi:hypothetical protein
VSAAVARRVSLKLISDPEYSIDQAFQSSSEHVDFEHSVEQLTLRLTDKLREHGDREYAVGDSLSQALHDLTKVIRQILEG